MFKRILIIGCSGSGKSTLSRELHRLTKLPVIHLDALYWLPNWTKKPKEDFVNELMEQLEKPEWIIDGNFDSTLGLRLKYADLVLFLDFPREKCVEGVLIRYLKNRGQTRIDMGVGCEEKMDMEFLRYIWAYNDTSKPGIVAQLAQLKIDSIVFNNRKQVKAWLLQLEGKIDGTVVHSNGNR